MSIDIAAEIKLSFVQEGEYLVRLQDADQTIIGKVLRDGASWIPQFLDGYFESHKVFPTRYQAARTLLVAYELANGLRDSEGRRVTKDLETNLWFVANHFGGRESQRWADKADAIAHLASLQPGAEVETITAYFPTHNGRVVDHGFGSDHLDRRVQQAYVNRNNAAAARRGDDSKPYALLTVEFAPRTEEAGVDFEEVGREAALQDQSAAPALNPQVRDALAGREVGDPENVRIMEAFSKGYQAVRDEQAAEVLAGPKTETEIVAQRSTRAAAERYIAGFANELGDTFSYAGGVKVPVHIEWDIVRAGNKFDIVSTKTPREIEELVERPQGKTFNELADSWSARVAAVEPKTGNQYAADAYAAFHLFNDSARAIDIVREAQQNVPEMAGRWSKLLRTYRGLPVVPSGTPLDANGDVVPASEDDGFKLGVVAPEDWEKHDHQRCIEAGEHRGSSRHTKAECTGIVDDRPTAEEQLAASDQPLLDPSQDDIPFPSPETEAASTPVMVWPHGMVDVGKDKLKQLLEQIAYGGGDPDGDLMPALYVTQGGGLVRASTRQIAVHTDDSDWINEYHGVYAGDATAPVLVIILRIDGRA